ncbi:MAG TPA: Holliday junction resolvase RecU [Epulopiscium sp.]|nr:Holliday junction resolvase RecU [Candidatus Epulonipiscium sp.]
MGYWNTRGLRGSMLEELITLTNDLYREKGLALVQKIPTPIKPTRIDQATRTITQAYFEQKSTVDFIGVVQGVPVCFDAKETTLKSFPFSNIHLHQIEFMKDFTKQNGEAFLIVSFKEYDEMYLLPFEILYTYWKEAGKGGRKSMRYQDFPKELQIYSQDGAFVHYLKALQTHLENKKIKKD